MLIAAYNAIADRALGSVTRVVARTFGLQPPRIRTIRR